MFASFYKYICLNNPGSSTIPVDHIGTMQLTVVIKARTKVLGEPFLFHVTKTTSSDLNYWETSSHLK